MSGNKLVIEKDLSSGRYVAVQKELTAEEIAQREADAQAWVAEEQKQKDAAILPNNEQILMALLDCAVSGDNSNLVIIKNMFDSFKEKYKVGI